MNNNFLKLLSVLLLGMILGYLLRGMNFAPQTASVISSDGSIKIIGKENAPITMVEYSDFQCPLCKIFYNDNFANILKQYVETGKVKYIFKHFPLNIHPQATAAALATECALEQNKFWEMHDKLFETQADWSGKSDHLETFKKIANQLNLDSTQFNSCMESKKYQGNVEKDYQEAIAKGVRGTPTFYINDQVMIGAQDQKAFTDLLDKLSAEK